ncbi:hypothetical protein RB195_012092 [Necator americanus]|uniref:Uncharacterized protein n=1 Tax=Necator americanus TaxID=51031 RepID=A0ABR1D8N9_NECAM
MDSALSHGRCNQLRRGFSRRLRTIAKDCAIVGVAIREARNYFRKVVHPTYGNLVDGNRSKRTLSALISSLHGLNPLFLSISVPKLLTNFGNYRCLSGAPRYHVRQRGSIGGRAAGDEFVESFTRYLLSERRSFIGALKSEGFCVFGIAFKVPSYRVTFKGRRFAFERTVSSRTANQVL